MGVPADLRYTQDHEWVRKEKDGTVTVGITDFAQKQLGEIVFVEVMSKVGQDMTEQDAFGTIESIKAVSELFAPVDGKVTATNGAVDDDPTVVNDDPYGEGWIVKLRPSDAKAYDGLMSARAYEDFLKAAEE